MTTVLICIAAFFWMFFGFMLYAYIADTDRFHWLTCLRFLFNWPGMLYRVHKEEWPVYMKKKSAFKKWYKFHFSEVKDRGRWLE